MVIDLGLDLWSYGSKLCPHNAWLSKAGKKSANLFDRSKASRLNERLSTSVADVRWSLQLTFPLDPLAEVLHGERQYVWVLTSDHSFAVVLMIYTHDGRFVIACKYRAWGSN